ncbi:MAG: hypothetical protein E7452_09850 [Ruminococcaceae bacterium]|nr:hypothetical protein [Oscillospiraceae bacterium]MBQ4048007.1 hypothetical protein [Clostridia bacterium]
MANEKKPTDFLTYKGKPLLRKDNVLYYGNMSDKYIIMLQILEENTVNGTSLPSRVAISLQQTDPNVRAKERIVRKSEKKGLYDALDLGAVWLERALAEKF